MERVLRATALAEQVISAWFEAEIAAERVITTADVKTYGERFVYYLYALETAGHDLGPALVAIGHLDAQVANGIVSINGHSCESACKAAMILALDATSAFWEAQMREGTCSCGIVPPLPHEGLMECCQFAAQAFIDVGITPGDVSKLGALVRQESAKMKAIAETREPPKSPADPAVWQAVPGAIIYKSKKIPLTGKPYLILSALIQSRYAITKDDVLEAGWGNEVVEDQTLRATISQLRSAIRKYLKLDKTFDPIPCKGRGPDRVYQIHPDLR